MNDRFRFRAWDKEQNKMFYNAQMTYDYPLVSDACEADSFGTVLEDNNMIVMQCTGLRDKYGKLIYEGDIVEIFFKSLNEKFIYIVEWDNSTPGFNFKGYGKISTCRFWETYEVIGNIYENKEILEK